MDSTLAFLPAPKTWIEYHDGEGRREGFLLVAQGSVLSTAANLFTVRADPAIKSEFRGLMPMMRNDPECLLAWPDNLDDPESVVEPLRTHFMIYAALAIINSPHVIGRTAHEPHRGLEKALRRSGLAPGKFPFRSWTEIKLHVTPPEGGEYDEPHLSGQKALHFCRAHLRIKLGRLEHVRAHWRGNAALGTKLSKYNVVP